MIKTASALRVGWREMMDPRQAAMEQMRTAGTKPYQSTRRLKMGMQLRSSELVNWGNRYFAGQHGK